MWGGGGGGESVLYTCYSDNQYTYYFILTLIIGNKVKISLPDALVGIKRYVTVMFVCQYFAKSKL